jgi:hypothetical protein
LRKALYNSWFNIKLIEIDGCEDCNKKQTEKLINKLFNLLNESNELLETLKIVENCIKKKIYFNERLNIIEHHLVEVVVICDHKIDSLG